MESKIILGLKKIAKPIELFLKEIIRKLFKNGCLKRTIKKGDFYNIPIYIISYNRLEYLKQTITWLEEYGYKNIIVIDNKSDYEPLLTYYKSLNHKVVYMKKNYGYLVFYKSLRFFFARNFHFYVLTDPDLTPIKECRSDFVEVFLRVMQHHQELTKVGFSLKIDDLPDDYYLKDQVIKWEKQFYENPKEEVYLPGVDLYKAEIDTTFAVNSPHVFVAHANKRLAIRVGEPYQMRHLPWYIVTKDDETTNYCKTIRTDMTNWNGNFSVEEINERNQKAMEKNKENK